MKRLFGVGKPKGPAPTLDGTAEKMDKRIGHVDVKIKQLDQQLLEIKQKMAKTPKGAQGRLRERAKQLLMQRKMLENQWTQMYGQQMNLEQIRNAQQQIEMTQETVGLMKDQSKILKKNMKTVDIDKIESMQDDMQDMMADVQDIQEVLSRSYAVDAEVDEDELEAEFAALDEEALMQPLGEETAGTTPAYLQQEAKELQDLEMQFAEPGTTQAVSESTKQQLPA